LVSTDHEGGWIQRLNGKGYFTAIPTHEAIGVVNELETSYRIGTVYGEELAPLGIHTPFAPVVDVDTVYNTAISKWRRSFSNDPDQVTKHALEVSQGMCDTSVLPTLKHFPGHGGVSGDTHAGFVEIPKTKQELFELDIKPYRELFRSLECEPMVMVGHLGVKKSTGSGLPASLNPTVIQDWLRGELDFKGLVITDGLTMGAITNNYSRLEAALLAILAGNDILLYSPPPFPPMSTQEQGQLIDQVCERAMREDTRGKMLKEKILEAATRISEKKAQLGLNREPPMDCETVDVMTNADHQALHQYIYDQAVAKGWYERRPKTSEDGFPPDSDS
ncbi:MAG: glycoside hydrolase family 3 N-terminal domain-containing protein, partial [Pseudomonadota bacterium]